MSRKSPVGGGNLLEIFDLAGGAFSEKKYSFNKQVTTTVTGHPLKGAVVIDVDIKQDDENIQSFFDDYLSRALVEVQEVEYEDSTKDTITSGLGAASLFGFILYGGADQDAKRKVLAGRGALSGDTGSYNYAAKQFTDMTVQITSVDGQEISISSSDFNSDYVSPAAPVTIYSTEFGCITHFDEA